ncbi:hypothetical protein [Caloramator mitchellensis]|nr:hypothetical protein [Caloramator mitchellensis]
MKEYLGKKVKVIIDRPLGSKHPKNDAIKTMINIRPITNKSRGR